METPVHSPREQCRVFLNGCPSPPKAVKRDHSSNKYMMDNLELELNAVLHDINMPLGRSSSDLPFNSRGIRDNPGNVRSKGPSVKGCMSLDGTNCYIDSLFYEKGRLYNNLEDENPWNARSGFLDEDFPDARILGAPLKNQPFEVDYSSADFFRERTYGTHEFAFEEPYLWNKRNAENTQRDFKILESSAPYLKHLPSEKNNGFRTLYGKRFPTVDRCWDFDQPSWSYFETEDAKDNMSLLSEESSSSSAVIGEKAKHSTSNPMEIGDSIRKHGSEVCQSRGNVYGIKNLCGEQTGYVDRVETNRGKDLKGSEKHTGVMKLLMTKPVSRSKEFPRVKKELEARCSPLYEEEYTSVDMGSGLGSFHRTSIESDPISFEWKYGSEDLFGAYSDSKLYTTTQSLGKRSKPDAPLKYVPPFGFEKPVFQQPFSPEHYDPRIFSTIQPNTSQVSRPDGESPHSFSLIDSQGDVEFPALSGKRNNGRDCEDKLEFRRTDFGDFREPKKEVSVGNNGFLSENEKTVDGASFKDTHCECTETKDETTELIEKRKTRDSSEHAEEMSSAASEILDKLEIHTNYQFEAGLPFPSQSGSKGKGETESEKSSRSKGNNSKDPSYLVMLESYVLQLLCVQKVLKEASEHEPVKKV